MLEYFVILAGMLIREYPAGYYYFANVVVLFINLM
jgi:hypothetical protein